MIKLADAFQHKKALIAFLTAGDPDLDTTRSLLKVLAQNGADLIEIGIPFSDPIAEGVVIQEADLRALQNGVTMEKIFDMIAGVRAEIAVPLVIMTYCNVLYGYGSERFIKRCREIGVNGLVIPDLPYEEKEEFQPLCTQYGVELVSMVAPTSNERIGTIAKEAEGFLYMITSGLTGAGASGGMSPQEMVARARETSDIPCAVSCDYQEPERLAELAAAADGVIVENSVVYLTSQYGRSSLEPVSEYIRSVSQQLHASADN